MSTHRPVPRLQCSGQQRDHEEVFLTIRTADPLLMECPLCGHLEAPTDETASRGVEDR